jgi:hypothetical protein
MDNIKKCSTNTVFCQTFVTLRSVSSFSSIALLRTEHGTLLRYRKLKHLISSRLLCGHPTLNPVDYKIWSVMQEKVYRSRICDVSELRSRIVEAWDEMDQRIIDESVKQWRTRLRACVTAKKGQFEHKL